MLVRGALAKGLLAGKIAKAYLKWSQEEVTEVQTILHSLSGNDSISGLALHYLLAHPSVGSLVLGASSASQLRENVMAYEKGNFGSEILALLGKKIGVDIYEAHR